jgi:hypothetical protein
MFLIKWVTGFFPILSYFCDPLSGDRANEAYPIAKNYLSEGYRYFYPMLLGIQWATLQQILERYRVCINTLPE